MLGPIFDAHLHIIDPRFSLLENHGYLPEPFTVEDYRHRTQTLPISGGAVVSGSFQGFDQSYLVDALERLGPGFVGVTQLPPGVADRELERLNEIGVRAIRFNLKRGGSATLTDLERMARQAFDRVGWHVELHVDGGELGGLFDLLVRLPKVSIDHLGLSRAGLPTLYRLVERGVNVKLTGFGRLDFRAADALERLVQVDARCLMFGTDLPSTRAARGFDPADAQLVRDVLGPKQAGLALHANACRLYRPRAGS